MIKVYYENIFMIKYKNEEAGGVVRMREGNGGGPWGHPRDILLF
jgi:hypothetical protein